MKKAIKSGDVSDWMMGEVKKDLQSNLPSPIPPTPKASSEPQPPIVVVNLKNNMQTHIQTNIQTNVQTNTQTVVETPISTVEPEHKEVVPEEKPESPKVPGRRKASDNLLIDYLNCNNKEAVIEVIRRFVISNNTGNGLALPFFALEQLELYVRLITDKEYSVGLAKQFADIPSLKSESSCRQAIGLMRKSQYVTIDGKQRTGTLYESDEFSHKLSKLKEDIQAVIQD